MPFTHHNQFGAEYQLTPTELAHIQATGLIDDSWRNDMAPKWITGAKDSEGYPIYTLWCDARDPNEREAGPFAPRFALHHRQDEIYVSESLFMVLDVLYQNFRAPTLVPAVRTTFEEWAATRRFVTIGCTADEYDVIDANTGLAAGSFDNNQGRCIGAWFYGPEDDGPHGIIPVYMHEDGKTYLSVVVGNWDRHYFCHERYSAEVDLYDRYVRTEWPQRYAARGAS